MENLNKDIGIIMVDDDHDDFFLIKEALEELCIDNRLRQITDGEKLLDYLLKRKEFSNAEDWFLPELILLDLNMPRKDGRQALAEIKEDPCLRHIPIIVFTTSNSPEDIKRCYELGANTYINKPDSFDSLVRVMESVVSYWLDAVQLPS